jgi:hypothetical protein
MTMTKSCGLLLVIPALALALLVGSPSPAIADGGDGSVRIEGVVTGINLATGQVAIQNRAGTFVVIVVPATKVERNGMRVPLAAFRLGDRGQARTMANGVGVKIEAVGP